MKTHLNCPCGEAIVGKDEDDLVDLAKNTWRTPIPAWTTAATRSCSWRTDARRPAGAKSRGAWRR